MTAFTTALAPLTTRLRTRAAIVRPVSQVTLRLTDTDASKDAIRETVAWLANRCRGAIPRNAFQGEPFDIKNQPGAFPTAAARVDHKTGSVWASRLDYADDNVAQRTWTTEISVTQIQGITHFGARLTVVTRADDPSFEPTVPGVVFQIISILSAEADEFPVTEKPTELVSDDFHHFLGLLRNPARRLPIVAISVDEKGSSLIDADVVNRRLCGAAHVVKLLPEMSWLLTKNVGKRLSVFNSGTRLYWPTPDFNNDNPFRHPLKLYNNSGDRGDPVSELARLILPTGFAALDPTSKVARFEAVQAEAAAINRALSTPSADIPALKRQLSDISDELAALRSQKADDEAAFEQLLEEAQAKTNNIARELEEARSHINKLRSRIYVLQNPGGYSSQPRRLKNYEDFDSWVGENLSGRIVVTGRAINETEKRRALELVSVFQDTLLMIRDLFVPWKLSGTPELRRAYEKRATELGITESFCFAQKGQIKNFPEYRIDYNGTKVWMERHFKYGTGYDPRHMFRIYYYWDEDDGVLVIGHMPTHLDNQRTT